MGNLPKPGTPEFQEMLGKVHGEIKEDNSLRAKLLDFEKKNPKTALALRMIPVVGTALEGIKHGTGIKAPSGQFNYNSPFIKSALSDALIATNAGAAKLGVVPTVLTEVGGTAGAVGGSYLGQYLDEMLGTKYFTPSLTIVGGAVGGAKGYKKAQNVTMSGQLPEEAIQKGLVSKDFVVDAAAAKMDDQVTRTALKEGLPLNVGWAPRNFGGGVWSHHSETPLSEFKVPFRERWDVVNHGADPYLVWLTGDSGTAGMMAERPYHHIVFSSPKKPMVQVGEVPHLPGQKNTSRNYIVQQARNMGADAIVFDGIADNQLQNQRVMAVFGDRADATIFNPVQTRLTYQERPPLRLSLDDLDTPSTPVQERTVLPDPPAEVRISIPSESGAKAAADVEDEYSDLVNMYTMLSDEYRAKRYGGTSLLDDEDVASMTERIHKWNVEHPYQLVSEEEIPDFADGALRPQWDGNLARFVRTDASGKEYRRYKYSPQEVFAKINDYMDDLPSGAAIGQSPSLSTDSYPLMLAYARRHHGNTPGKIAVSPLNTTTTTNHLGDVAVYYDDIFNTAMEAKYPVLKDIREHIANSRDVASWEFELPDYLHQEFNNIVTPMYNERGQRVVNAFKRSYERLGEKSPSILENSGKIKLVPNYNYIYEMHSSGKIPIRVQYPELLFRKLKTGGSL